MYKSPSTLPEKARGAIADTLNARLADGLDLHGQTKVAHWNIKGPQFPSRQPAHRHHLGAREARVVLRASLES